MIIKVEQVTEVVVVEVDVVVGSAEVVVTVVHWTVTSTASTLGPETQNL